LIKDSIDYVSEEESVHHRSFLNNYLLFKLTFYMFTSLTEQLAKANSIKKNIILSLKQDSFYYPRMIGVFIHQNA